VRFRSSRKPTLSSKTRQLPKPSLALYVPRGRASSAPGSALPIYVGIEASTRRDPTANVATAFRRDTDKVWLPVAPDLSADLDDATIARSAAREGTVNSSTMSLIRIAITSR
jgi:hypothetical protein